MSHRIGRVAHIIRDVVSDTIANKLSDPRISRFTSVTRVELSPDLRLADVYVSVMGTPTEGDTTLKGLESARGLLQTRVARQLDMRQCPILRLYLDLSLKKASQVIQLIEKAKDRSAADAGCPTPSRSAGWGTAADAPPAADGASTDGDDE